MSMKRVKWVVVVILLALGSIFIIGSTKHINQLRDFDEPAWVSSGYYLDLYLSGDWSKEKWREFDKYANHPPGVSYVFGAVLHAIGEPMTSMEPRRFWYENDLDIVNFARRFLDGLYERITYRQVMAARYIASVFAAMAGIVFFLIAYRLFGLAPALAGYLLMTFHYLFYRVYSIGTGDSLMIFLSVILILLALKLGDSISASSGRAWVWGILIAILLGFSFASKIVAFAWVAPVAVSAVLVSRGRRTRLVSLAYVTGAFLLALAINYFLDPGLHNDPIAETLRRIAWRKDRIEIQQVVFVDDSLVTLGERFFFAVYHMFFSRWQDRLIFAPLFGMGIISLVFPCSKDGPICNKIIAPLIALLFFAITLYSLPLAWLRYVSACLPFMALVWSQGFAFTLDVGKKWHELGGRFRLFFLSSALVLLVVIAAMQQIVSSLYGPIPRKVSAEDIYLSKLFAFSLIHPRENKKIHKILLEHFEKQGDSARADFQRSQLKSLRN